MSRLDDHVAAVQNRLALRIFIESFAWGAVFFSAAALIAVLMDRIFLLYPPKPMIWLYAGAGVTVLAAMAYAIAHRPGPREAAVPIDQKLELKEKISTALYARPSDDPFAKAAVLDAEESARQVVVQMGQHFPLSFPRPAYAAMSLAVLALLSYHYINPMSLFNRQAKHDQQMQQDQQVAAAKKTVAEALAKVDAMPKIAGAEQSLQLAKAELTAMLTQPITDPSAANRTAVKALQDVNEAMKETIKNSAKYAQAQNEMKMMRSMQKPQEGQGPVSDAHRAIADGKFSEAIDELSKAVENFDKLDKADQQKAAQQMQQLAQQIQQMSSNPAQQQKMQQQLQQMGMNQQQAQQAQQLMQQAAQGNQQAQQQLQQMAQQAMQQQNNGQPPNPQQQQQMQQMMQQMQAQMNAQQQAQNMAQSAQQMAQAMQQATQQQQQAQQQPQQGQQANQGMNQAMNQMQQQLQQMQAAAQDAQQIAAAQAAAQQAQNAAQQAMGGGNGAGQQGQGGGMWSPNANIAGQNNQGFNPRQGAGGAGGGGQGRGGVGFAGANNGGQAAGDRTYKSPAPYAVKQEVDPSQEDEKGRILASFFIKDNNPNKGSSTETLKEVADRALNEQTDEIDQERVSRPAQQAVKDYFSTVANDQK